MPPLTANLTITGRRNLEKIALAIGPRAARFYASLALDEWTVLGQVRAVDGAISSALVREGRIARLSNVVCTFGKRDRPYPEVHERDAWTVALVRRGTFAYRGSLVDHPRILRAGWLLVGPPGAEFECSHEHDGGDDCASLRVSQQVIDDVARASGAPGGRAWSGSVVPPLPRVSALLERSRCRDEVDLDEVAYLVAESVIATVSRTPILDVSRHPGHEGRMHDVIEAIEASCREPLPLAQLAAVADLSPFHFLRVFRRATGTTPHQYLIAARLRLAAKLLLETTSPVTQVAYEVGFEDLSNFVRTFHRVIGCSPRAYRKPRRPAVSRRAAR